MEDLRAASPVGAWSTRTPTRSRYSGDGSPAKENNRRARKENSSHSTRRVPLDNPVPARSPAKPQSKPAQGGRREHPTGRPGVAGARGNHNSTTAGLQQLVHDQAASLQKISARLAAVESGTPPERLYSKEQLDEAEGWQHALSRINERMERFGGAFGE